MRSGELALRENSFGSGMLDSRRWRAQNDWQSSTCEYMDGSKFSWEGLYGVKVQMEKPVLRKVDGNHV